MQHESTPMDTTKTNKPDMTTKYLEQGELNRDIALNINHELMQLYLSTFNRLLKLGQHEIPLK